jgi:hypothetical protein
LRKVLGQLALRNLLETECAKLCSSCLGKLKPNPTTVDISKVSDEVRVVKVRCRKLVETPEPKWCGAGCAIVVTEITTKRTA